MSSKSKTCIVEFEYSGDINQEEIMTAIKHMIEQTYNNSQYVGQDTFQLKARVIPKTHLQINSFLAGRIAKAHGKKALDAYLDDIIKVMTPDDVLKVIRKQWDTTKNKKLIGLSEN